ncbi:MAG: undecaprenyl/decaprenyl-phosphate alpha-N-acetylglucosaminyl 1-phosphate transferase [Bacteroidetes bacterium]|nr:MAG: undecaprenyl/decaprenyl-phosphate alpha-N-acetylglucosaminyl 1-phosphate transferase [Bacteroidota bacterium]
MPVSYLLFSFLTSLLVAVISIPSIIGIAQKLDLYDKPGERKLHISKVPLLGGLAIFAATLIAFSIWASPYFEQNHLFILASLFILFFMGLRDDIIPIRPAYKLIGQILAAYLVIHFCDLRFSGLHGFFGIHTVSHSVGAMMTTIIILFLINAFNLIDGSDGLAAGLGFIASVSFGILFFLYQDFFMAVLSFTLAGALLGFLFFNFHPARIFMGDTGSMTVGFIISILTIRFVELNKSASGLELFNHRSAPVAVLAILIIPAIDAFRVFVLRLLKGKSPFNADRLHIHHKLLELGFSQAQLALLLYAINVLFIGMSWFFRFENPTVLFYLFIFSALLLAQLPQIMLYCRKKKLIV